MMTEQERLDRRRERRLGTRFRWAANVLEQAGFVEWGSSDAHGRSLYYIPEGSETDDESNVRIRVSDHYAHTGRGENFDFTVQVHPDHTRRQVQRMAQQIIQERADYLVTEAFKQFCKDRERLVGYPYPDQ
jgi:hypothetical protein